MSLKSTNIKPVLPADRLLSHLLRTTKVRKPLVKPQRPLKVDTQPRTNEEFAEDHIRGEVLDQLKQ